MTLQNTAKGSVIIALFVLGACATPDTPVTSMSCTELAMEIGKMTQARDEAAVDSVAGAVNLLFADTRDDEIEGGIETLVGDVSGAFAQDALSKLRRVFIQNGCS